MAWGINKVLILGKRSFTTENFPDTSKDMSTHNRLEVSYQKIGQSIICGCGLVEVDIPLACYCLDMGEIICKYTFELFENK